MAKTKIYLDDIINEFPDKSYEEIYKKIMSEIESGTLFPIKSSKTNGRKPSLMNAYWRITEDADYSWVAEELKFRTNPVIDITYFSKYPQKYNKYQKYIQLMSNYLDHKEEKLTVPVTINERSFDIFHNEKFLDRNGGKEFLSYIGMSMEKLNFYKTSEPMSYYSDHKLTPQKFLIIENKDTFYSMRRHLIEGKKQIVGMQIGTLIYGGGKGIYRTFEDYVKGVEPYFTDSDNELYYFGDLDYEGIGIYEKLCSIYQRDLVLFLPGYEKMLEKAQLLGIENLPTMKQGQNSNIGTRFLNQFSQDRQKEIIHILQRGYYIPQEIINETDY